VRVGRWAAPAAALAAAFTLVGAAGAITYGAPDGTNGVTHPYVGALIATNSKGQKQLFCSGSLIAPTVFLTAAHCTAELEAHGVTQVWVTFDQQFTSTSRLIAGTMHTDPLFGGITGASTDPNDLAVITLARRAGVTPVQLPTAGLLDSIQLKAATFTNVGYGIHQDGVPWDASRWYSVSGFNSLNAGILRTKQNPSLGFGGTCTGDSGGPQLYGAVEVAVTETGDPFCKSQNDGVRLDTPNARAFLSQFVALP